MEDNAIVKLRPAKRSSLSSTATRENAPPYGFVIVKGKKLGQIATRAFFDVRQFLVKEVPVPSAIKPRRAEKPQKINNLDDGVDDLHKKIESLKKTVAQSHEMLARSRTLFPFTLFPDDIMVDRTKVTIIRRDFLSQNTISIRIEDILNIGLSTGPFFGSLNIASRVMNSTDHFTLNFLPKKDAIDLKLLIQGYVIAQHNNIDTSHLELLELIDTLKELGNDNGTL